jgi:F-type H+-transporting ATPase subunit delta
MAELRITEAIKKRTGALRIKLETQVNPELIGGYRLRIGDEIIDASVRSQLRRLESCLAAGTVKGME